MWGGLFTRGRLAIGLSPVRSSTEHRTDARRGGAGYLFIPLTPARNDKERR
jgi:hypothetical protein